MRAISAAILVGLPVALVNCGQVPATRDQRESDRVTDGGPSSIQLSEADQGRVCRASIADLNGHEPKIVSIDSKDENIIRLRYNRPSDGKLWINDCRIVGDRIEWRTIDAMGPKTGPGRWRTAAEDEVVTFKVDGSDIAITVTFPGEVGTTNSYTVN